MIFADLTKHDMEEKKRLQPIMNKLWKQNHKVRFEAGKWFVDGSLYQGTDAEPEADDEEVEVRGATAKNLRS